METPDFIRPLIGHMINGKEDLWLPHPMYVQSYQLSLNLQETPFKVTNLGTQIWRSVWLGNFVSIMHIILQVSLISEENLTDFRIQILAALPLTAENRGPLLI